MAVDIHRLAVPNVVVKIGGLAMLLMGLAGMEWINHPHRMRSPQHIDYYLETIEAFGPERCMFRETFPWISSLCLITFIGMR